MVVGAKRTVLVVDDDPWNREAVELALVSEGYRVLAARDGLEGLALVYARRPDLVLLDVMMPRMDGPAFLAELRRRGLDRGLPIILLTATPGYCSKSDLRGVAACLAKPFDLPTLLQAVEDLIAIPA